MKSSAHAEFRRPLLVGAEGAPQWLRDDPRWQLAESVAAGPHFSRSPLLSKFLLYIVAETLEGRQSAICEHKIGVAVFGRSSSYRTDEDNIVRNYARQLRKRLVMHFSGVGRELPMQIEIPVGGYVPTFRSIIEETRELESDPASLWPGLRPIRIDARGSQSKNETRELFASSRARLATAILLIGGLVVLGLAFLSRAAFRFANPDPMAALWSAVLPPTGNTYIVPPDAGFNLMEDISHQPLSLANYIKGGYQDFPLILGDEHTSQDLHTQQYTDFVSLQIVTMLSRQPQYDPRRVLLRFPRDLRIDDLKSANAFIIGSASSNPWASMVDHKTNFHIVTNSEMRGASIINSSPRAGEQPVYESQWNEPAHDTFALIVFQPNLSGNGHLLVIEGLDVAGTQAAAELLFNSTAIAPIVELCRRSDGTLRPFEILLRTRSIQSNAAGAQVVAYRAD